jgi:hypothetical protein
VAGGWHALSQLDAPTEPAGTCTNSTAAVASSRKPMQLTLYYDHSSGRKTNVMKHVLISFILMTSFIGSAIAQNLVGNFSATLSGFQPTPAYAQLSVTSSASNRVSLPGGTTIVVYNTASNDAYVTLGDSSVVATTLGDVVKAGGWMAFAVGSTSFLAGVTSSGITTLNISGGSGLPTGSAGANTGLIQATASIPINISTATTTQLIAASGSTKIYVTAWDVIAAGPGSITIEYGTGTNCAIGATPLTGAYPLTAQSGEAHGTGLGPILIVPAGNALCALTSQAVQMSGSVAYTQF